MVTKRLSLAKRKRIALESEAHIRILAQKVKQLEHHPPAVDTALQAITTIVRNCRIKLLLEEERGGRR